MKQGTTALVATAILLGGASAVVAQPLPPVEGRRSSTVRRPITAAVAPAARSMRPIDGAMPSYEVAAILRSRGFLPLGGPIRRGGFYVVSAVHPSGERWPRGHRCLYRVASSRFVPAAEVTRASRGDEMVLVYQGPTFPPPDGARPFRRRLRPWPRVRCAAALAMRGVPRPPRSVPRVASRTPSSAPVTPKPRPQAAPQRPDTAQAPPVPAPVETKPAAASPPLVPKPRSRRQPAVQPTKPLPPVQTME